MSSSEEDEPERCSSAAKRHKRKSLRVSVAENQIEVIDATAKESWSTNHSYAAEHAHLSGSAQRHCATSTCERDACCHSRDHERAADDDRAAS